MPFDWTTQPEAAGPMTEPGYGVGNGPALDIQALRQSTIRLPQLDPAALEAGAYVPLRGPDPYHDPDMITEDTSRYNAGREALRAMFEGAARSAGASPLIARATASELLRRVPGPAAPAAEPEPAPEPLTGAAEPVEAPAAEAMAAEAAPEPVTTAAATETEPAAVRPRSKEKS